MIEAHSATPFAGEAGITLGKGSYFLMPQLLCGALEVLPGEGMVSRMMNSIALPEGADFIWNRAWRIPYLRTLSKAMKSWQRAIKKAHIAP